MKIRLLSALAIFLISLNVQAQTPPPDATAPAVSEANQGSNAAYQSIDPAKVTEIRKMLELTGTAKLMNRMVDQMIASFKASNSKVPADFWDRFAKEVSTDDLINKMIPLYDKYYSLDDLKAMNAFYESPAGQRVRAATPQIMQDSMQIGQEWGRGVGMKITAELDKEKEAAASSSSPTATPTSSSTPAAATPPTGQYPPV